MLRALICRTTSCIPTAASVSSSSSLATATSIMARSIASSASSCAPSCWSPYYFASYHHNTSSSLSSLSSWHGSTSGRNPTPLATRRYLAMHHTAPSRSSTTGGVAQPVATSPMGMKFPFMPASLNGSGNSPSNGRRDPLLHRTGNIGGDTIVSTATSIEARLAAISQDPEKAVAEYRSLMQHTAVQNSVILTLKVWQHWRKSTVAPVDVEAVNLMLGVRNRASHPMSVSPALIEIKDSGVDINRHTAVLLLEACARFRDSKETMYVLHYLRQHAQHIDADIGLFNDAISAFANVNDWSGAMLIFVEATQEYKIAPTNQTYASLMKAFGAAGNVPAALDVINMLLEQGPVDSSIYDALITAACRSNDASGCMTAMQHMQSIGGLVPSSIVFTSVINTLRLSHDFKGCFQVLNEMRAAGHQLNTSAYTQLIQALIEGFRLDDATELVTNDAIITINQPQPASAASSSDSDAMTAALASGDIAAATALAASSQLFPTLNCFNLLIGAHGRNHGGYQVAVKLRDVLSRMGHVPTIDTYNALLLAAAGGGGASSVSAAPHPVPATIKPITPLASLIRGRNNTNHYGKSNNGKFALPTSTATAEATTTEATSPSTGSSGGDIESVSARHEQSVTIAQQLMTELKAAGLTPTIDTYNAYIAALHGHVALTSRALVDMQRPQPPHHPQGIKPDIMTYKRLLHTMTDMNHEHIIPTAAAPVDQLDALLDVMITHATPKCPDGAFWNDVLRFLTKRMKLEACHVIITQMIAFGHLPTTDTFSGVLTAFVAAGRIDTAFQLLSTASITATSLRHDDDTIMLRAILMGAAKGRSPQEVEQAILQVMDLVATPDPQLGLSKQRHVSLLKALFDALVKAEAWSAAMVWLKRLQSIKHDITFDQYRTLLDLLRSATKMGYMTSGIFVSEALQLLHNTTIVEKKHLFALHQLVLEEARAYHEPMAAWQVYQLIKQRGMNPCAECCRNMCLAWQYLPADGQLTTDWYTMLQEMLTDVVNLRLVLLDKAYQRIIDLCKTRNDRRALILLMDHLQQMNLVLPRMTMTHAMDIARQSPVDTHAVNAVWNRLVATGVTPSSAEWSIALRAQEHQTASNNRVITIWQQGLKIRDADAMVVASLLYGLRSLPNALTTHVPQVAMKYIQSYGQINNGGGTAATAAITNTPSALWTNDVRREMTRLVAYSVQHWTPKRPLRLVQSSFATSQPPSLSSASSPTPLHIWSDLEWLHQHLSMLAQCREGHEISSLVDDEIHDVVRDAYQVAIMSRRGNAAAMKQAAADIVRLTAPTPSSDGDTTVAPATATATATVTGAPIPLLDRKYVTQLYEMINRYESSFGGAGARSITNHNLIMSMVKNIEHEIEGVQLNTTIHNTMAHQPSPVIGTGAVVKAIQKQQQQSSQAPDVILPTVTPIAPIISKSSVPSPSYSSTTKTTSSSSANSSSRSSSSSSSQSISHGGRTVTYTQQTSSSSRTTRHGGHDGKQGHGHGHQQQSQQRVTQQKQYVAVQQIQDDHGNSIRRVVQSSSTISHTPPPRHQQQHQHQQRHHQSKSSTTTTTVVQQQSSASSSSSSQQQQGRRHQHQSQGGNGNGNRSRSAPAPQRRSHNTTPVNRET